jgi:hypothetical protein
MMKEGNLGETIILEVASRSSKLGRIRNRSNSMNYSRRGDEGNKRMSNLWKAEMEMKKASAPACGFPRLLSPVFVFVFGFGFHRSLFFLVFCPIPFSPYHFTSLALVNSQRVFSSLP